MKSRPCSFIRQLMAILALIILLLVQGNIFAAPSTADRMTPEQSGNIVSAGIAASTKIYKGTLVAYNASGYLIPAADTAGIKLAGVAQETVDNSTGIDDAASVPVKRGVFKFVNSSTNAVDMADKGMPVYVEDDHTVADSTNNSLYAGIALKLDDNGASVWVDTRYPLPTVGTVADAAVTTAKLADGVADSILTAPSVAVANTGTPDGNATVTIQLKDAQGNSLSARAVINVWFAASAWAVPADLGTLTASTGSILKEDTDDALATCVTSATGALVLVLDTASNGTVHAHASVGGLAATGNAAITGN